MITPVAVINSQRVVRLGLTEALTTAGFSVEDVTDVIEWIRLHRDGVVLAGVRDDHQLDVVVELVAASPDLVTVVVSPQVTVDLVTALLRAGARAVIALDDEPTDAALALQAAQADKTLIHTEIAAELARRASASASGCQLSDDELDWLRSLAGGLTVSEVAKRCAYSEREMFRRLRRLYNRMGVKSRTEALIRASRWGLLD